MAGDPGRRRRAGTAADGDRATARATKSARESPSGPRGCGRATPANDVMARATAHGGVPRARGQGSWARPKAEAPVSCRCRARTVVGEGVRVLGGGVRRVEEDVRGHQRGRPAGALVGLGEAADGVEVHRDTGELLDQPKASSAETAVQPAATASATMPALVAHQREPAADQHQRRLAVLAQVAGEPPPEGDHRVLAQAVRRGEQPGLAQRPTTWWAKIPSATTSGGTRRARGSGCRCGRSREIE